MTRTFASQQGGVGTFAWAAPEVLQGKPCSFPADIYSFGVQGESVEGCAEHGLASLHSFQAWRMHAWPAGTPSAPQHQLLLSRRAAHPLLPGCPPSQACSCGKL